MRIERSAAVSLLGEQINPVPTVPKSPGGMWRHFKVVIADTYGWKAMLYLVLRFPVGIFTFTLAITLIATSLGSTFAPTYMWAGDNQDWLGPWFDSYTWSFALVPIGITLTFVSLHILNALARACGRWTRSSLS